MADPLELGGNFGVHLDDAVQLVGNFATDARPFDRQTSGQVTSFDGLEHVQKQLGIRQVTSFHNMTILASHSLSPSRLVGCVTYGLHEAVFALHDHEAQRGPASLRPELGLSSAPSVAATFSSLLQVDDYCSNPNRSQHQHKGCS